jgi:hypothetical protein
MQLGTILLIGWTMLWGVYGLAGWGDRFESLDLRSNVFRSLFCVTAPDQRPTIAPAIARLPLPLPRDYLVGLDRQAIDMEGPHRAYLAGQWRRPGWWYYYFYGIGVKEPCGTLTLAGCSLVLWSAVWTVPGWRKKVSQVRRRHLVAATLTAVCPLGILLIASLQTGLNEHVRYVMAVLPFLYLLASGFAARRLIFCRFREITTAAILTYVCISSAMAYPHSLSYFNELAGGPANGINHLSASNIDWGQDLLSLAHWKERMVPVGPIYLAYAGRVNPNIAGIEYQIPPRHLPSVHELTPGWYAISVSFVQGRRYAAQTPDGAYIDSDEDALAYFRDRAPSGRVGYSILLYHVVDR